MGKWDDARHGAMHAEEAALLPALPRGNFSGSAALREMIRAARAISEKQLSNAVDIGNEMQMNIASVHPAGRAALHHVLRR